MKKALPLIIIVLVLSVGVAGYFVWKHLSKKDEATPTPPITPVNTSNPNSLGTSPGLESVPEIFIKKPLWIEPIPQPVATTVRVPQPVATTVRVPQPVSATVRVPQPVSATFRVPQLVSATMPARPNIVSAIRNHNTL